jgi:hypothetical protein
LISKEHSTGDIPSLDAATDIGAAISPYLMSLGVEHGAFYFAFGKARRNYYNAHTKLRHASPGRLRQ